MISMQIHPGRELAIHHLHDNCIVVDDNIKPGIINRVLTVTFVNKKPGETELDAINDGGRRVEP